MADKHGFERTFHVKTGCETMFRIVSTRSTMLSSRINFKTLIYNRKIEKIGSRQSCVEYRRAYCTPVTKWFSLSYL